MKSGEEVSSIGGGGTAVKGDAKASWSFSSHLPLSCPRGGLCYPRIAGFKSPSQHGPGMLVGCVHGQGCRGEWTASGEPISLLPSRQGLGLGVGRLSFARFIVCMFAGQPAPLRRCGAVRGCTGESWLTHRARVFAPISSLAGPGFGLCYLRYTKCTSLCFLAPGRRVRGGHGAGKGRPWRLHRGRKRGSQAAKALLWISIQCPPQPAMGAPSAASGWQVTSLQVGRVVCGFLH